MIEVYTTENCAYCHRVKEYLKAHNISFIENDVIDNMDKRTEMIEKSGGFSVPVIVDGDNVFVGFDKDKLSALVDKYGGKPGTGSGE